MWCTSIAPHPPAPHFNIGAGPGLLDPPPSAEQNVAPPRAPRWHGPQARRSRLVLKLGGSGGAIRLTDFAAGLQTLKAHADFEGKARAEREVASRYESKLTEFGIPVEELGFRPLVTKTSTMATKSMAEASGCGSDLDVKHQSSLVSHFGCAW